ncbi:MAG: GAF domain-containing protein, partial [Gammaproteobacteria bacterium]
MLDILRRIVQEVSTARDLDEALSIIVTRVREALGVDVCSVYQALPDQARLVLKATVGLSPDAVGRVSLAFGEGLVGLVAERAEPINLDRAPEHPAFRFLPETGEQPYQAFLGVPIIHQRRLLGVLVVQNRAAQRFNEDHLSMLVTLAAQLAGAISHAEAAGEFARVEAHPRNGIDLSMEGVSGAPGVAVGSAAVVFQAARLESVPDRVSTLPEVEIQLFR